jgi:hypothetical protein
MGAKKVSVTLLTALGVVPVSSEHSVVQVVAICSSLLRNLRAGLVIGFSEYDHISCPPLLRCFRWVLPTGSLAEKWDALRYSNAFERSETELC